MRYVRNFEDLAIQKEQDGGLFGRMRQPAQQPQQAPMPLPPAINPMAQINQMYTRQAPQNSLAPMQMYQNYKATGQMPAEPSSHAQPQAFSMTRFAPGASFSPAGAPTAGGK